MKSVKFVIVALATLLVAACAKPTPPPSPELRAELAKNKVDVQIKQTNSTVHFYTRTTHAGRSMAQSNGLAGLIIGTVVSEAGKVQPTEMEHGLSVGVADQLRKKVGQKQARGPAFYTLVLTDGAVFTPTAGFSDFALSYRIRADVRNTAVPEPVAMVSCTGTDASQMHDDAWRASPQAVKEARARVVELCSQQFISQLTQ